ncbi:MAG: TIGR02147 family protein [Bdellovibrio sp.]|jgi:uncharacterized protein (TIGR02147 family)
METKNLRETLNAELKRRQDKNPAYSLRAFAKNLGLSPAQVSQVISGKRVVTMKTYRRIAEILHFSPLESMQFLEEISKGETALDQRKTMMSEDEFRLIADWWHFAILSLTHVKGMTKDAKQISERLGISPEQARQAIERLERMGVLSVGSKFEQLCDAIRVITEKPSVSIQRSHQQTLALAAEKLSVPLEKRDFTSMTMAINPKNIPKAKKAIEDFRGNIVKLLDKGDATEVYTFACQLFPLSVSQEPVVTTGEA